MFAATDISAEVVYILPSLRRGLAAILVESRGIEPLSKLRSILEITYTIANITVDARDDRFGLYHHHLFRWTVKQEDQLAQSQSTNLSMNLKYLLISKYTVLARRLIKQPVVRNNRNQIRQFFCLLLKARRLPVILIHPIAVETKTTP